MASLIAYLQMGHETDCSGFLVEVSWRQGGAHPYSYQQDDITPDLCAPLPSLSWSPILLSSCQPLFASVSGSFL